MSHKKKKKSTDDNELMALQITSMADIFTIILVFLLKSFASSSIALSPGVQLPHVNTVDSKVVFKESITVEVQEKLLLLDQKPVIKLKKFFAEMNASQAINNTHETEITLFLNVAFTELKKKNTVAQGRDWKLTIMADQNAPYVTLQEIIAVAARHGFKTCQLVMVKDT